MAAPESIPTTLAQLIGRRGRPGPARSSPPSVPPADVIGQFGFTFTDPLQEPAGEPADLIDSTEKPAAASSSLRSSDQQRSPPETSRERRLWSVAELVSVLRGRLEREYADVWVEGEISNCRPASSGHLYFTLKDGDAQLPVVLFRRQAVLLKWRPQDGLAVLVRGRVSVFESRGQLQLIAENLEPRGAGALQLEFEQLKAKLRAEGLFDAERKRALPAFPRTIGVVTSMQGAVIRDIVSVCRRRHGCVDILVYPSAVQGMGAAAEIAAGLRYFNRAAQSGRLAVDVVVLARGGGSAEDLWAFNDEALARAIAASELPVVSAVGHETDFTIADFVADLRAPTPSAAAELVTAAQHRIEERVQALQLRLWRGIRFQQMMARQRYTRLATEGVLRRVRDGVERRGQRLDLLREALERGSRESLRLRAERLREVTERLRQQEMQRRVADAQAKLKVLAMRTRAVSETWTARPHRRLAAADARLQALSPMAVLERGYTLSFNVEGRLLRSAEEAAQAGLLVTRFGDGTVRSRVQK